jgi:hypothetical protein
MNSTDVKIFKQAVELAQSGHKDQAYSLLKSLEASNPNDLNLILWLAFTSPNFQESELLVNKAFAAQPDNPVVRQSLDWLNSQRNSRVESQPPPPFKENTVSTLPVIRQTPQVAPIFTQPAVILDETILYQDKKIQITNARAVFASKTYAVPNIISVSLKTKPRKTAPVIPNFFLGVGLILAGVMILIGGSFYGFIFIVSGGLIIWWVNTLEDEKPIYIIRMVTSGSEVDVLITDDKGRARQISDALNQALIMRSTLRN